MVRGRAQEVATRVRLLCYDLLLRGEEARLTERSLERLRQALEETRGRARAGLASDYDVLRLEVELANLEPKLLEARNARASARRRLGLELALEGPVRLRLAGSAVLASAEPGPALPAGDLVETALAHRSDVIQLRQAAELGRRQVRLEQVEYLPKLSLFATWDVQAQQDGRPDFFGSARTRATSRMAGLSVDLPLFTGLQRDARIDHRRAALRRCRSGRGWPADRRRSRCGTWRRRWPRPAAASKASASPWTRPGGGSRSPAPASARASAASWR